MESGNLLRLDPTESIFCAVGFLDTGSSKFGTFFRHRAFFSDKLFCQVLKSGIRNVVHCED